MLFIHAMQYVKKYIDNLPLLQTNGYMFSQSSKNK